MAGLILAAAACASAPEAAAPPLTRDSLRVLRWVAPGADTVKVLTTQPASCDEYDPVATPDLKRIAGKLAFESPALLGGAAGRMGLSCASCHRNGRDNPDFFIEGVSGAPGTADVTNSLFSKVRGNGAFDPVPIPDLVARDGHQIKNRHSQAFLVKVHGLVVEEFDGQEPPVPVMEALLAYLDGLDPTRCAGPRGDEQIDLMTDTSAITSALGIASAPGMTKDVSVFLLRVARERLERIYERFAAGNLAPERDEILALSRKLSDNIEAIRAGGSVESGLSWSGEKLYDRLQQTEHRSLYNPDVLRAALAR